MKKKLLKVVSVVAAVWAVIARYPAVSAGLFQVIVVLGAAFGLHLTTAQLGSGASFIAAVFGVLVHMGVIPVTKVDNVRVGLKPAVKGQASMLTTPMVGQSDAKMAVTPAPPAHNPFGPSK
jgi:hypothetical protein